MRALKLFASQPAPKSSLTRTSEKAGVWKLMEVKMPSSTLAFLLCTSTTTVIITPHSTHIRELVITSLFEEDPPCLG